MKRFFAILAAAVICFSVTAQADLISVGTSGDYQTLTEAVEQAEDGDEIVLGEGSFDSETEQFPVVIDKQLYIHGESGYRPVIRCGELKVTLKLQAPGIVLEDVDMEFLRYGLNVLADDVVIHNCSFTQSDEEWRETSCGMWIGGAKHVSLLDNRFEGCGIAVAGPEETPGKKGVPVLTALFEVGEDPAFFNSHEITGNTVNGKPLAYVTGLSDCVFSEDCGQLLAVDCHNVVFTGLDVSRASIGMQISYSSGITVRDSAARDCGVFGIYLCKSTDCLLTQIDADACAHGLDIRATDRCIVDGCHTNGCGQGIFYSWSRNCVTKNCEMVQDGTGFFSAGGENDQIMNCLMEGNELGLYIKDEAFTITDTVIKDNTSCGLRFTDARPLVYGCTFENNFVAAMALSGSTGALIGNQFEGSQMNSVYCKNSGTIILTENQMGEGEEEKIEQIF